MIASVAVDYHVTQVVGSAAPDRGEIENAGGSSGVKSGGPLHRATHYG